MTLFVRFFDLIIFNGVKFFLLYISFGRGNRQSLQRSLFGFDYSRPTKLNYYDPNFLFIELFFYRIWIYKRSNRSK